MKIDLKLNKLYLHTKGELYNSGILFKLEKKGMNAHPTPLFFVIYTYIHKCYRTLMGILIYAQSNKCSISTVFLDIKHLRAFLRNSRTCDACRCPQVILNIPTNILHISVTSWCSKSHTAYILFVPSSI